MLYCIVDVETTGLDVSKDKMFEIAMVVCDENLDRKFDIHHRIKVGDDLMAPNKDNPALKHYDKALWEKDGVTTDIAMTHIAQVLGSGETKVIPVGHNVRFDLAFIGAACEACKVRYPFFHVFMDTMSIAAFEAIRRKDPLVVFSLTSITKKYKVKHKDSHSAVGDVEAVYDLLKFYMGNEAANKPKQGILL